MNLQKNSTFYFQIGLIVCLLVTVGLLEMNFEKTIPNYQKEFPPLEDPEFVYIPLFKDAVPVVDELAKKQAAKLMERYEEVPDNTEEEVLKKDIIKTKTDVFNLNPEVNLKLEKEPVEPEHVPFVTIQSAPIYPGCESAKDNFERKKCMAGKITKLIQRKFKGNDIALNYGLTGKQKIDVQFTIDKTGKVTDVKTRATHPKLDGEALRVINFIPNMIPGRQNNKNVGVIYNLPIVFQVD